MTQVPKDPYREWRLALVEAVECLERLNSKTVALVPAEPALAPRLLRLISILDRTCAELMGLV
jgi:hypothetical protein